MKKAICDHAGAVDNCADLGDGKPCPHFNAHFRKPVCRPWPCFHIGKDTPVRCVEAPE